MDVRLLKRLFVTAAVSVTLSLLSLRAASERSWDRFDGITDLLSVRSLCQDESGTVWFGTDRSLYSFDGYDLRAFSYGGGNLQVNVVRIFGDDAYLATNSGVFRFDRNEERISPVEGLQGKVTHALETGRDTLWVGTEEGLYAHVPSEGSTLRMVGGVEIHSLALAHGRVYLGARGSLLAFTPSSGAIASLADRNRGQRIFLVTTICPRGSDGLWIGTPTALLSLDFHSGELEELARFPILKALCRDGNSLLVGTDDGLFRYETDSGKVTREGTDVVWALMRDRQQGIWAGTDNGLCRQGETSVFHPLALLPGMDNVRFEHLLRDSRGRLWLGGNRGIVLVEGGRFRHFQTGSPASSLPHNKINVIREDPRTGTIYAGTDIGYLAYNEKTFQFDRFRLEGTNNWIYDILVDGDALWFATYDGLFRKEGDRVTFSCTEVDGLADQDVSQVVKDAAGVVWLLTRDQRLWTLAPGQSRPEPCDFSSVTGSPLVDLLLSDGDGRVWICSRNRLVLAGREPVLKADLGLEDPASVLDMTDIGDRILLCTAEGLFAVDKRTGYTVCLDAFRSYAGAGYDPVSREVLLGGLGKADALSFTDLELEMNRPDPQIRFTEILVNGKDRYSRHGLKKGTLVLGPRENNVNVRFSDFNFSRERRRRALFRLSGHRSGWSRMLSDNNITLSGLSPGRYEITVGSQEGRTDDRLILRVKRPFFQSWGMIVVYLALLIGLVVWIISYFIMRKEYKMEQEKRDILIEQSRQKSDFFMNIAHELKTPLSLVLAPLSKAEGDTPPGPQRELLSLAKDNAMKLSSLIHMTLDIYNNRKEAADSLLLTDVEFVEFARNILETFRRNYPDRDFVFSSARDRMLVHVDIIKMETCLNNMLSNACKYTQEGGSVILTLDLDPSGNMVIKVSDTGIGIPRKDLPFVFQRFFQSSRTQNGKFDSSGVGLSILKTYVDLHGGTVSADSDDNGTTFVVTIPSRTEDLDVPPVLSESSPADSGKPLVAIVEDNPQVCSFLEGVLGGKYRCISVHDGKSGLKLCKDVLPDLIISDVLMPVMDGMEMCRLIRSFTPLATVPIILLTAKGDPRTENESISLGIDAFIPKPFDLPVLLAKVDQLLGSRKRLEQSVRLEMIATPDSSVDLTYDEKLLKKVTTLIEDHLDDHELSVTELCRLGGYNEKQLYRKLKQLTGMSTVEYIRSIRLKKAALMLQNGGFTVSEVMYSVGFSNISYFSCTFYAAYKQTPSEYMKSYRTNH